MSAQYFLVGPKGHLSHPTIEATQKMDQITAQCRDSALAPGQGLKLLKEVQALYKAAPKDYPLTYELREATAAALLAIGIKNEISRDLAFDVGGGYPGTAGPRGLEAIRKFHKWEKE